MITKLCRAAVGAAIALVSPMALADTGSDDIVSLRLAQVRLALEARGSVCVMKRVDAGGESRLYSLDIPYPCSFHRDKSGEVRLIRSGKYEYALIESSKHVDGSKADCETHLRAIRAAGKHLQVSQHKERVASCPPFQWDRLLFTELFN